MVIILALYGLAVWLVFKKFHLLPWNLTWKIIVYGVALVIALVVIGALNYQTPSGGVSVQGAAIEITPNVSGTVVEVGVTSNTLVDKGHVLFRIDDTTFVAEVARAEAALVAAKTAEAQLGNTLKETEADIANLEAQLAFGIIRRDDIIKLSERGASSGFQMQEAVSTIEQLEASLLGARARKANVEVRMASQIDGVDSGVVDAEQALVLAKWNLEQTVVVAPSDGYVASLTLRPGNRVTVLKSAMTFFSPNDRVLAATFPQSSAHGFKIGDPVRVALRTLPGSSFETTVSAVLIGTSEGTLDARASLPSLREIAGGASFVVVLAVPDDLPGEALRLGSSGTALRITDNAGPVKALAEILFLVGKFMNYI